MTKFKHTCEICGTAKWGVVYHGQIRDGSFGSLTKETCLVAECERCGVQRLHEEACRDTGFYEDEAYRKMLDQSTDVEGYWEEHDKMQLLNLSVIWPCSLRNSTVAEIGCAGGSFLDHIRGLPSTILAIEPCKIYHDSLKERGYKVYPLTDTALASEGGCVDYAFSFSVIEHVSDPMTFLVEIGKLLGPSGRIMISTPNRSDVLMDLLAQDYPPFFYRTVHRWYFDVDSFTECARRAGLEVERAECRHRFGIANAMMWLRDKSPKGDSQLKGLGSKLLDDFWKRYLESNRLGDYLYFTLKKRDQGPSGL